jgi:uncharacterized protein
MKRWRFLFVFAGISVGSTAAIAVVSAMMGWTVNSAAWGVLAPIAMWAPAVGRFVCRRTVDRGFTSTLPLRHWGATGIQVILVPLLVPLVVYGTAYAMAWAAGLAYWNPGGGRWTTGSQIAANVLINLPILAVIGTFTALGEELGWRGYLQPRLDLAGIRSSVVIVWLCQLAYHAPLMAGAGYADTGSFFTSFTLFAVGDLSLAFLWARESYRAGSLWPAVFFHSFHNTVSQWLFPRFFTGADDQLWLGETGVLPVFVYVVVGVALFLWMRWRGPTWSALASNALTTRARGAIGIPRTVVGVNG